MVCTRVSPVFLSPTGGLGLLVSLEIIPPNQKKEKKKSFSLAIGSRLFTDTVLVFACLPELGVTRVGLHQAYSRIGSLFYEMGSCLQV